MRNLFRQMTLRVRPGCLLRTTFGAWGGVSRSCARISATAGKNVTANLLADTVRKSWHMTLDLGRWLSGLFMALLERHTAAHPRYEAAMERQQALMQRGLELSFTGQVRWTRDTLHKR